MLKSIHPALHYTSLPHLILLQGTIHSASSCAVCASQGLVHARITFKNEASGEYTFFEVKLTSSAPAPMGRLSLECPVRNQTSATVNISNPLSVPVTLKPSISSKQVSHT